MHNMLLMTAGIRRQQVFPAHSGRGVGYPACMPCRGHARHQRRIFAARASNSECSAPGASNRQCTDIYFAFESCLVFIMCFLVHLLIAEIAMSLSACLCYQYHGASCQYVCCIPLLPIARYEARSVDAALLSILIANCSNELSIL